MTVEQQRAILAIALMAAFADGGKDDREREELRKIAESLAGEADSTAALDLPGLYQDVLMKRVTLESAVANLTDPAARQLAYEMAVCMIDADGQKTAAEADFLSLLAQGLGLDAASAQGLARDADAIAEAAYAPAAAVAVSAAAASPGTAASRSTATLDEAALDRSILNASILNGALELLPQSWATMAIVPLQTRLVYKTGKAYGYELDAGHIKEFLATVGVGMASQYLEQAGRKLIGGLVGKVAGRMIGGLARGATGMAFSFATTYALGQLAKRYYGGGRTMSTAVLKQTFDDLLGPAKEMQARYVPQIQDRARNLDMTEVLSAVRGN